MLEVASGSDGGAVYVLAAPAELGGEGPGLEVVLQDEKTLLQAKVVYTPMQTDVIPMVLASIVHLDRDLQGQMVITNSLAAESAVLGEGVSGRLVPYREDDGEADPVLVDTLLQKRLCQCSDTGACLVFQGDGDSERHYDVDVRKCRYREGAFKLDAGIFRTVADLAIYVFLEPRSTGGGCFMDLVCIYKLLRLTQSKGRPSKWKYDSQAAWQRRLAPHLGLGHFVHGIGADEANLVPFVEKCLPSASMSLLGLVVHLAVWCSTTREQGGFVLDAHRASCRELLHAILKITIQQGAPHSEFVIGFDPRWSCQWPRPISNPHNYDVVKLPLTEDGVDLRPWKALATTPRLHTEAAASWQGASLGILPDMTTPLSVVWALADCQASSHMFQQVAWGLTNLVELVVLKHAIGRHNGLKLFDWLGVDMALHKSHDVDKKCAQTCRSDWQFVTLSNDEGDGGSLPLVQSFMAFPDNQGFLNVPQVSRIYNKTCQ
jgi:hypothetical protein